MRVNQRNRPRVALIGLSDGEASSIEGICGVARRAASWRTYCQHYSVTETDAVVARQWKEPNWPGHLMVISPILAGRARTRVPSSPADLAAVLETNYQNTERETSVSPKCPQLYRPLAAEMVKRLNGADEPPAALEHRFEDLVDTTVLVRTTSNHAVALRQVIEPPASPATDDAPPTLVLALTQAEDLAAWFQAFLEDIHTIDRDRVPQLPPRLTKPEDWYTPGERETAARIAEISTEIERQARERQRFESQLADESEIADKGTRRAIWADGDDLVAATEDILAGLGFDVRNMDSETPEGAAKREDLRLTRPDWPEWEAIAEVKGYSNGTKTSDARQIREHRDHYIKETGRFPDRTLWIANPYRGSDPDARPAPDENVKTAAENVAAVHVLTTDLYRLWARAAARALDVSRIADELRQAAPGFWSPDLN